MHHTLSILHACSISPFIAIHCFACFLLTERTDPAPPFNYNSPRLHMHSNSVNNPPKTNIHRTYHHCASITIMYRIDDDSANERMCQCTGYMVSLTFSLVLSVNLNTTHDVFKGLQIMCTNFQFSHSAQPFMLDHNIETIEISWNTAILLVCFAFPTEGRRR